MPFRAQADGDPIVFRHSYWHGQVRGGSVVIKHLKFRQLELHMTAEGFVFVGEPSCFQGGAGPWTEFREDGEMVEDQSDPVRDEDAGEPQALWVQGAKRPQKVDVSRATELLREQGILWRQGDNEWKFIAREARLRDPERDRQLGRGLEVNTSNPLEHFGDMYTRHEGVEGLLGEGGAAGEPPPLEELIYQDQGDGSGYAFRIF